MAPNVRQHSANVRLRLTDWNQNPSTKPDKAAGESSTKEPVKQKTKSTGIHGFDTIAGKPGNKGAKSTGVHGFGKAVGKPTACKVRKTVYKYKKSGGHRLSDSTVVSAGDEVVGGLVE